MTPHEHIDPHSGLGVTELLNKALLQSNIKKELKGLKPFKKNVDYFVFRLLPLGVTTSNLSNPILCTALTHTNHPHLFLHSIHTGK